MKAARSHATLSPSMDIQVASNFERALFEACDRDADWTAAAMSDFARDKRLGIPQEVLAILAQPLQRLCLRRCRDAGHHRPRPCRHRPDHRSPHRRRRRMPRATMARPGTPTVILSTAHPAKFPDAVAQAIGAAAAGAADASQGSGQPAGTAGHSGPGRGFA